MAFDPRSDVSVTAGAFSVDANELCAVHTLMTYQEALTIGPAKAALYTALGQVELSAVLAPAASVRLAGAIYAALAAIDALEAMIDTLLWKLQTTALAYGDAEARAAIWEIVPGSPTGPQISVWGAARSALAPGGILGAGRSAAFHGTQDLAARAGMPGLAAALMPSSAFLTARRDLWNTAVDGLAFAKHADPASGTRLQRDLGRFTLTIQSCPLYRGVATALAGSGVSQNTNTTSTQSTAGVSTLVAAALTSLGWGHGPSYGVVVRGTNGHARIHPNSKATTLPMGVFDARTRAALAAMPQAAADSHYNGIPTSADTIQHITDMHGGDADNGEIAIEEHVTPTENGDTTRSWTVTIRGTQSFNIGQNGPQDMLANLQGVAGMPSDQLHAVTEAMNAAGIKPGEAVEFAGHSQGGIMAAQLASHPDVRAQYNVVSVVTAGSPTATIAPKDVPVLAYENSGDIVPGLDGQQTQGANVTTVTLRDYQADAHPEDPVPSSHSASLYADEIRSTLNAAQTSSDPGLNALAAAEARRIQALGLTHNTQTTIHHYQTRRVTVS